MMGPVVPLLALFAAPALLLGEALPWWGALPKDPALCEAATALAHEAHERGDLSALSEEATIRLEVTRAGALVSEPLAAGVLASSTEAGLATLQRRVEGWRRFAPTKACVVVEPGAAGVAIVALSSRAPVALDPLPQTVEAGALVPVRGRLLGGLRHPQLHVAPPGGQPVRMPLSRDGETFSTTLHLATKGRTTVEIIGVGADGPEVALLAHVYVGEPVPAKVQAGAADVDEGDEWMGEALRNLRRERGLAPLARDPALDRIAQAYARELARTGRFGHVSAEGQTAAKRLRAAGYAFSAVGENLGEGPTARAAFQAILRSPAHHGLLLDPSFTAVGIGIAERPQGEGVVLVQLLATPRSGR